MRGGEGLDSMDCGAGNDEMHVEPGDDVVVCDSGNDRMLGDFISGLFSFLEFCPARASRNDSLDGGGCNDFRDGG